MACREWSQLTNANCCAAKIPTEFSEFLGQGHGVMIVWVTGELEKYLGLSLDYESYVCLLLSLSIVIEAAGHNHTTQGTPHLG